MLCNLSELYRNFKDKHPTINIGFSKFAELRPQHCVLAGSCGTHTVCVCMLHQNVKLMIDGAKLPGLTKSEEFGTHIKSYQDCLARIICNPPQPSCYFDKCTECPGTFDLKKQLESVFDEAFIDSISCRQWVATDKTTLESLEKSTDEFINVLISKLGALKKHSFIARQQRNFYEETKINLKQGEFLVTLDFAENYAFVIQDEVPGFHWDNNQATVHPFVVYHRNGDIEKCDSFVVISDCLKHDTVAVHLFQKQFINFLKQKYNKVEKIVYFSDGASSQYKNRKNFSNLCHHEEEFGIKAEWHFFATSHGKEACDGIGGTIKRQAARASLQRPIHNQITTPFELFQWAIENLNTITFCYVNKEDYARETMELASRFERARTVPGTLSIHACIPVSKSKIVTKIYSSARDSVDVIMCRK